MQNTRHIHMLVALAVSATLIATSASTATASPHESHGAEGITDLVRAASPDAADAVQQVAGSESFRSIVNDIETVTPIDGGGDTSVTLQRPDGSTKTIEVTVVDSEPGHGGELIDDDTITFGTTADSSGSETPIATQTLEDGSTRIHSIIAEASSNHRQKYRLEGFTPTVDESGVAHFIEEGGEGMAVTVEAPWATDAAGRAVETHYEVDRDSLVQVVSPGAETSYPVVADPTWGWKSAAWGLSLNRKEVAGMKDYAGAVGICLALQKKVARIRASNFCGAWAGYALLQATTANKKRPRGCLHFVVAPAPGALLHIKC